MSASDDSGRQVATFLTPTALFLTQAAFAVRDPEAGPLFSAFTMLNC